MMTTDPALRIVSLPTHHELQSYIHQVLCDIDRLDSSLTPVRVQPLTRAGKLCGMIFYVEGPRKLRNSAVWSSDDQRVLVYNSIGEKVMQIRLSESPA